MLLSNDQVSAILIVYLCHVRLVCGCDSGKLWAFKGVT